jgi:hypothetical protein
LAVEAEKERVFERQLQRNSLYIHHSEPSSFLSGKYLFFLAGFKILIYDFAAADDREVVLPNPARVYPAPEIA